MVARANKQTREYGFQKTAFINGQTVAGQAAELLGQVTAAGRPVVLTCLTVGCVTASRGTEGLDRD